MQINRGQKLSSFNFAAAKKSAAKIIADFGAPATLTKKGETGGYDAEGNIKAAQPDVVINGTATVVRSFTTAEIDGEKILHSDGWVFFDSVDEPEIGMSITLNGYTWRVVDMPALISPSGDLIWRKLHLRR